MILPMSATPVREVRMFFMNARQVWPDLPLRSKGMVVGAVPVCALLIATFTTYSIERQRASSEAWISHTLEVCSNLQQIFTLELDAQSAVRGFRATHNERLLKPLSDGAYGSPRNPRENSELVADNPDPAKARRRHGASRSRLAGSADRTVSQR